MFHQSRIWALSLPFCVSLLSISLLASYNSTFTHLDQIGGIGGGGGGVYFLPVFSFFFYCLTIFFFFLSLSPSLDPIIYGLASINFSEIHMMKGTGKKKLGKAPPTLFYADSSALLKPLKEEKPTFQAVIFLSNSKLLYLPTE